LPRPRIAGFGVVPKKPRKKLVFEAVGFESATSPWCRIGIVESRPTRAARLDVQQRVEVGFRKVGFGRLAAMVMLGVPVVPMFTAEGVPDVAILTVEASVSTVVVDPATGTRSPRAPRTPGERVETQRRREIGDLDHHAARGWRDAQEQHHDDDLGGQQDRDQ